MKNKKLTPSRLRIILAIALSLLIILHFVITFVGQKFLIKNSKGVTDAVTQSQIREETLKRLSNAENQLKKQSDIVEKSRQIVASGDKNAYQDQIIQDITRYADIAGIRVLGFTFASTDGQAPSNPSSAGSSTIAAIPGLKTETVMISLSSPIEYSTYLTFLRLLEGNLLQLQLQSFSISAQGGTGSQEETETQGSPTLVQVPNITLEVYKK